MGERDEPIDLYQQEDGRYAPAIKLDAPSKHDIAMRRAYWISGFMCGFFAALMIAQAKL